MKTLSSKAAPLLVLLALVPAACGGGEDQELVVGDSDPAEVPRGAVAIVGDDTISKRELDREVAALRRRARGEEPNRESLTQQAMTNLLRDSALAQEAKEHGVAVSNAVLRERLEQARRGFSTQRAFEQFLGGQTEAELMAEIGDQILTDELSEKAGGDPAEYSEKFAARWRDKTICREDYITIACDNLPSTEGDYEVIPLPR